MSRISHHVRMAGRSRRIRMLTSACIETLEQRTLLTDVPSGYRFLEHVAEGALGDVSSTNTLESGKQYFLIASGISSLSGGWYVDAENEYMGSTHSDSTDGVMDPGYDAGFKGSSSSTALPNWGHGYNSSHVYTAFFDGTGAGLSLGPVGSATHLPNTNTTQTFSVDIYEPAPIDRIPGRYDDGGLPRTAAGANGGQNGDENTSRTGVRYSDGTITVAATDLVSNGFGQPWGMSRSWSNYGHQLDSIEHSRIGNSWLLAQNPYVTEIAVDVYAVATGGGSFHYFDKSGSTFTARNFDTAKLTNPTGEFVYKDSTGRVLTFDDMTVSSVARRGQLKKIADPGGNETAVSAWTTDGKIQEIRRTVGTNVESWLYTYNTSGTNIDLISNVKLRRSTNSGSTFTTARQVDYEYYDTGSANGLEQDLKKVTIKDGATTPNVIDTYYYRYYTDYGSSGYRHALKLVLEARSYARLAAAVGESNIETTSDGTVETYADKKITYDSKQRVTSVVIQQAAADSGSAPGLGTYLYTYTASTNTLGYNNWAMKTVETLPELTSASQKTVYSNGYGQTMLELFTPSGGNSWATAYQYDTSGRVTTLAEPSAVTTTFVSGEPTILADTTTYYINSTGLVHKNTYVASGTGIGYFESASLRRGYGGSDNTQLAYTYTSHSDGAHTIYPIASAKTYRNDNTTGDQTTSFSYTWYANSNQIKTKTTSYPIVTTAQNGENSANADTVALDLYGRTTWTKDGLGYLQYFEYYDTTGAIKTFIDDAAQAGSSPPVTRGIPGGPTLPTALALTTSYTADDLGRTTSVTQPRSTDPNVTWIVYNDAAHEKRIYPGFVASTSTAGTTMGPIQVMREYRPTGTGQTLYIESLTSSATPVVVGSKPDGSETISSSNIQTLTRYLTNTGGQVTAQDDYFSLSGVTYSQSVATLGSSSNNTESGGNYHATTYDYDQRGRQNRTVASTGTITISVYDALSRVTSVRVGTNDSGGGSDNMTTVVEYQYDGASGAVGDGNLTKITGKPGTGSDRVTDLYYDWRDRLVLQKSGVEGTESSSVNRPILYFTYDNLDQAISIDQFDGDQETISSTNGVPNVPTSGDRRARSITKFDERGRVYQTAQVAVVQSGGSAGNYSDSTALFTDTWYDARGNVIKTSEPGGLVGKFAYDGPGRLTKTYATDGGGDTVYGNAADVTGDYVLTQTESKYDDNGNVIFTISKDRFHDETSSGELANAGTSPKARVSHVEYFYDRADRVTGMANLGTNGGTALTSRPDSVLPSRADDKLVSSFDYNNAGWISSTFDPRNIETRSTFDLLGRTTRTIEAWVDGTASASDDRITNFFYDGNSHVLKAQASLPGSGVVQETQYVYGATKGSGDSDIASNDLLATVKYPNKSTGAPSTSSSDQEIFKYNALGETKGFTDRNQTTHELGYDIVGRLGYDKVTAFGTGVDTNIELLGYTFDEAGLPYQFISYSDSAGTTIANEVRRIYNDLGQLKIEYQEDAGAVNTTTSADVDYAYSEMPSGANHSRLTSMTYPDNRVLEYQYNTGSGSAGLDARISRVSYLDFSSASTTKLEEYSYLGLGTVVKFAHPQNAIDLTYVKISGDTLAGNDAGDQYSGLDRFGRIVDQFYTNGNLTTGTRDRFQYGYDRNGNAMYRDNQQGDTAAATFDELYHTNTSGSGYDKLDRVTDFQRGTLNTAKDQISGTASRTQGWTLDALGNWDTLTTNGTGTSRTHNKQNQITANGSGTYSYSNNGNLTSIVVGSVTTSYTYDAWNRLLSSHVSNAINTYGYAYDALGRRIQEVTSGGTSTPTNHLYYSAAWQVILEQTTTEGGIQNGPQPGGVGANNFATTGISNRYAYVWSPVYIDAVVLRDKDATGDGTYEQRLYVQHDANFNVTAVTDTSGVVQERFIYDPYGAVTFKTAAWGTRSTSSYDWKYQFEGLRYDKNTGLSDMRMRVYSPGLGRPMQADPAGYVDGMSLYQAYASNPTNMLDPMGLASQTITQVGSLQTGVPPVMMPQVTGGDHAEDTPDPNWPDPDPPVTLLFRFNQSGRDPINIQNPGDRAAEIKNGNVPIQTITLPTPDGKGEVQRLVGIPVKNARRTDKGWNADGTDQSAADQFFEACRGLHITPEDKGGGRWVGKTAEGITIILRPDNEPTIEVQYPVGPPVKIRYPQYEPKAPATKPT